MLLLLMFWCKHLCLLSLKEITYFMFPVKAICWGKMGRPSNWHENKNLNEKQQPTENTVMDLLLDCQVIFIDDAVQTSNSSETNTRTAKY